MIEKNIIDDPVLLDTHVLIWLVLEPHKLSDKIKTVIKAAQSEGRLLLASISLWEIAMLRSKNKIEIELPLKEFLQSITEIDGLKIVDLSPEIAADSAMFLYDFHADPADRIITATALNKEATLLSRDRKILAWADGRIRAMEA